MADAPAATIEVELVYAFAREQLTQILQVPPGTTVGEAIERSGVLARHPEIATRALKTGIFGRRVTPAALLREYDRIEIYRPLVADPKQARRARARRSDKSSR
jgi:putative ubiquitin-RnfH superfamily antitoxin RatB of RatAB toxin-antitoxin module